MSIFKSKGFRLSGLALIVIIIGLVAYYQLWFLRLPGRDIPHQSGVFVSPANGVVTAVEPWGTANLTIEKSAAEAIEVFTGELGDSGIVVSIAMNVTNVHYQRAPAKGRFIKSEYSKGKFHNALIQTNNYGIRFENEHNTMLFETESGMRYKVVQIAGFLARRIVDFMKPNTEVEQGDLVGLIKLGSQVSLILPYDVEVMAKPGEVVIDGETILAKEVH